MKTISYAFELLPDGTLNSPTTRMTPSGLTEPVISAHQSVSTVNYSSPTHKYRNLRKNESANTNCSSDMSKEKKTWQVAHSLMAFIMKTATGAVQ
jgi:hypothetical protein